jgi:hypothetical protein
MWGSVASSNTRWRETERGSEEKAEKRENEKAKMISDLNTAGFQHFRVSDFTKL